MRRSLLAGHSRGLWILLAIAFSLRIALLLAAPDKPRTLLCPDSQDYMVLAESIAEHGTFTRHAQPEIFRTPGYPVVLLLGTPFGDSWWLPVVLLQILIDTCLVFLTWSLTRSWFGDAGALWAAGFQALSSAAIASSVFVLTDGLFAAVVTVALILVARHLRAGGALWAGGGGVLLGLATYLRPVGLPFALVLCAFLCLRRGSRRAGLLLVAGALLVTAPWVARNHVAADYLGFSSFAGDSLYGFGIPKLIAERDTIDDESARQWVRTQEQARWAGQQPTPGAMSRARLQESLRLIGEQPLAFLRLHVTGCGAFLLPGTGNILEALGITAAGRGTLDVFHRQGPWAAARHYLDGNPLAVVFLIPTLVLLMFQYTLGLVGSIRRFQARPDPVFWMSLIAIAFFAAVGGTGAVPRYRVPVEPLLSALAGTGTAYLVMAWRSRRDKRDLAD